MDKFRVCLCSLFFLLPCSNQYWVVPDMRPEDFAKLKASLSTKRKAQAFEIVPKKAKIMGLGLKDAPAAQALNDVAKAIFGDLRSVASTCSETSSPFDPNASPSTFILGCS